MNQRTCTVKENFTWNNILKLDGIWISHEW